MRTNPSYAAFLKKLNNGYYKTRSGVKTAITLLKNLTNAERTQAELEANKYFTTQETSVVGQPAPVPEPETVPETPAPTSPTVASIIALFMEARVRQTTASSVLRAACEADRTFSDDELVELFALTLESAHFGTINSFASFSRLINRYGHRVTTEILNVGALARSEQFWGFLNTILAAGVTVHPQLTQAVLERIPAEAERRASDTQQVEGFERVIKTASRVMGARIVLDLFGPVLLEHASPKFVFDWLQELDEVPEDAVHQFAHRLMGLYTNNDISADALMALMEFEPGILLLEELIRCLLVQQQLGDALLIADQAPEKHKAQLYRVLHPVVVAHGDAAGLVTFGMVFPKQVDRSEIKALVKRFFAPDHDEKIEMLIEGVTPNDYFESMPSVISPSLAAQLRDELLTQIGHAPVRTPRNHGQVPSAVRDLLDRLGDRIQVG